MVEDSEDDAHFIQEELEKAGYEVNAVRVDTASGLQAALTQKNWHVILCDHAMPGFSAPAALRILHETGLDIPFIIVSGIIGDELAVSLMRAGAHDFVMKDRLGRLIPAIEREMAEAYTRKRYQRATEEQGELSRRIDEEHAQLEQKIIELGALNHLFQQHMGQMDQAETDHQVLLKQLGGMILNAVEDRHQSGNLPEALPPRPGGLST
jgi:DNA-binding NtrC family response regulator